MKPSSLFLLVALIAGGCAPEAVLKAPPAPVNWHSLETQENPAAAQRVGATELERRVVPAYMKAISTEDLAGLPSLIDEHAHFTFAGFGDVNGRTSVVRAHRWLLSQFGNRKFVVTRLFVSDESQAVEWTLSAVHLPSQKPIVFEGLTLLWTRDNGNIKDVHFYYDEGLINTLVGAPKGPSKNALRSVVMPPDDTRAASVSVTGGEEEKDNILLFRSWLDALEDSDETGYLAKLSDTVDVTTNTSVEHKKPAQRKYYATMHAAIDALDTQLDSIWSVGSFVIAEYHLLGEQRGSIGWVPAQKDMLLKVFSVDICEIHDGKITQIRRYDNPAQILESAQGDAS